MQDINFLRQQGKTRNFLQRLRKRSLFENAPLTITPEVTTLESPRLNVKPTQTIREQVPTQTTHTPSTNQAKIIQANRTKSEQDDRDYYSLQRRLTIRLMGKGVSITPIKTKPIKKESVKATSFMANIGAIIEAPQIPCCRCNKANVSQPNN